MAYQNEMQDIQKVMEVVRPYAQWQPPSETNNISPALSKVVTDSKKSHLNSHDK
jgi:hypothetical protein